MHTICSISEIQRPKRVQQQVRNILDGISYGWNGFFNVQLAITLKCNSVMIWKIFLSAFEKLTNSQFRRYNKGYFWIAGTLKKPCEGCLIGRVLALKKPCVLIQWLIIMTLVLWKWSECFFGDGTFICNRSICSTEYNQMVRSPAARWNWFF